MFAKFGLKTWVLNPVDVRYCGPNRLALGRAHERLSYRHPLTHFWCWSSFPPTSNFVLIIARTQRREFPAYLCILGALFTTHTRASCCVVCCTPSYCCELWVCLLLLCMLHAHTHVHNLYIYKFYFALRRLVARFFVVNFYFFLILIHLHKRHHRNAEQNAPLFLSFGAYIGRQSARLRSMCEKWANYFQAEQMVRKTKGRRESWIIRGAARALLAGEIWAQLFARYFLELFILRSLLFAFAITPLSLSMPQINYHRITWTLTYWLWFEYFACKSSQSLEALPHLLCMQRGAIYTDVFQIALSIFSFDTMNSACNAFFLFIVRIILQAFATSTSYV